MDPGQASTAVERHLVFVYGTLKRGHGNHHWLAEAVFLGTTTLRGAVLHDLGPFPMAIEGEGTVWGEVYGVDEPGLARLDRLEGCPRLYRRCRRVLADGRKAWVYLGSWRQVRNVPRVADGCWQGPRRGGGVGKSHQPLP
jgi:gamma-glutamylcyclotransferase (GGCT)/AIG2-like uncharacterized protein YtfP